LNNKCYSTSRTTGRHL